MSDEKAEPRAEPASRISEEVWNAAVGEWLHAYIRSSPLSHDVGAWNRLNEVLPKLREVLNNHLSLEE